MPMPNPNDAPTINCTNRCLGLFPIFSSRLNIRSFPMNPILSFPGVKSNITPFLCDKKGVPRTAGWPAAEDRNEAYSSPVGESRDNGHSTSGPRKTRRTGGSGMSGSVSWYPASVPANFATMIRSCKRTSCHGRATFSATPLPAARRAAVPTGRHAVAASRTG